MDRGRGLEGSRVSDAGSEGLGAREKLGFNGPALSVATGFVTFGKEKGPLKALLVESPVLCPALMLIQASRNQEMARLHRQMKGAWVGLRRRRLYSSMAALLTR